MDVLNKARDVIELIKIYQVDNDHVLHRRFRKLHLYNLYQKHNRLVELDKKLLHLESRLKPVRKVGTSHPDAKDQAASLDALISDIDAALKDFGRSMLGSYVSTCH
jgi:hypothetical protein